MVQKTAFDVFPAAVAPSSTDRGGPSRGRPGAWWASLALVAALVGCASGKGSGEDDVGDGGDGADVPADARFLTDVFTWACQEADSGVLYQGVFGQTVSLEYAPGAIKSLDLPSPGSCSADLDMFPRSAGDGALDVPELSSSPRWETDEEAGVMDRLGRGFYRDDVFPGVRSCVDIEDVLGSGARLVDAGVLSGATAPAPLTVPTVQYEGLAGGGGAGSVIAFGDEITATWDDEGWDETWLQISREKEGVAFESATCNATGSTEFTIDEGAWGLLTESLEVQQNSLYVGHQRTERSTADDGTDILTITRAIAVAVVAD